MLKSERKLCQDMQIGCRTGGSGYPQPSAQAPLGPQLVPAYASGSACCAVPPAPHICLGSGAGTDCALGSFLSSSELLTSPPPLTFFSSLTDGLILHRFLK